MRNSLGPMRMRVVGTTETGIEGTVETGTVGIVKTGAMGVAGAAAEGIPTPARIPGPSKVSAKYEIDIQIKGDCSKGETQTHTCKEEMTKKWEE